MRVCFSDSVKVLQFPNDDDEKDNERKIFYLFEQNCQIKHTQLSQPKYFYPRCTSKKKNCFINMWR